MHRTVCSLALSVAGALTTTGLLVAGVAGPASADDHPPIFDFSAHRTSGSTVVYSGRYAVWNDADQAYERADSNTSLHLDDYTPAYTKSLGTPWNAFYDINAGPDGSFSGSMQVYPKSTLRASTSVWNPDTSNFDDGVASSPATVPYYGPMPVFLNVLARYQAKAGAPVTLQVEASPSCEVNKSTFGYSYCPLTQRVIAQSKIRSKWKTVGTFSLPKDPANGGIRAITVKKPKGTQYRFYLPGNRAYKRSYSKVFRPSPVRPEN